MSNLADEITRLKKTWEYAMAGVQIDLSSYVYDFMQMKNITREDLASAIGTSSAYIGEILSGSANPSLEMMAKIAHALDARIELKFVKNNKP